ncbi:ORF6C domain-containing protein [Staphylococcus epidermidis]|uniref:ORF6C domain-containing protein n=1 Tax=Staphylococcus epidermidis TaxID=1282 RepID=UPI0002432C60|nr:ORF6C domain-containing protein [Staphylococcus epidermidis]APT17182.1 hypothetical protein BUM85_09905 [Staphylococcus epidermidis]EHM72875.1 hypothetical protein HMPREF9956_0287 [Staphylococcus epidermidis 14.1.R1.SE]MDH9185048.1 ORF6C domain-containing protein [Staphylococcus epidermidis]
MSKNLIDISRRQADQLVQQAEFSRELFIKMEEHDKKMKEQDEKMNEFESKMIDTENRLNKRMEENEKNNVLSRGEGKYIQSKVGERSYYLTDQFFKEHVSKELYHKKRCHFIQGIYSTLNKHFNSITYTTIRHVDFAKAMEFIGNLELVNMPPHFLRLTDKQIDTAERHGDYGILERLA